MNSYELYWGIDGFLTGSVLVRAETSEKAIAMARLLWDAMDAQGYTLQQRP